MAEAKTDRFHPDAVDLARCFKALGHPARLEILRVLAQKQACICGDIVEEIPLAQSTISQHLKVLKEAGFIQGSVDGPAVCYCLDEARYRRVMAAMSGLLPHLTTQEDQP